MYEKYVEEYINGKSLREIAEEYHISRNTIKKYIGYIANENCI